MSNKRNLIAIEQHEDPGRTCLDCKRHKTTSLEIPAYSLYNILSFLNQKDLVVSSLVCNRWRYCARNPTFWKDLDCTIFGFTSLSRVCGFLENTFLHDCPVKELSLTKNFTQFCPDTFARLRKCTTLTSLELPPSTTSINQQVLDEICQIKSLVKLNLSTHGIVTDISCQQVYKAFPYLSKLSLDFNRNITCQGIQDLIQNSQNLKELSVIYCPNAIFGIDMLRQLVPHLKKLTSLCIEIGEVSPSDFEEFIEMIPKMERLKLRGMPFLTGENIHNLTSLPYIQCIHISCTNSPKIYNPIISSHSLKEFHIQSASQLSNLRMDCPNLSSLSLLSISKLDSMTIHGPNLVDLKIRACNLTCPIFPLESLKTLHLVDCTGLDSIIINKNDKLMDLVLFMLSDLLHLSISSTSLTSLSVDMCMNIKMIHLECASLEKTNFFSLPQGTFPNLQVFRLSSSKIASLSLQRCVSLKTIEIESSSMTALNLADCRELETLHLDCCNLSKFALSAPCMRFTSNLISHLTNKCPKMYMLSLCNSQYLQDVELETLLSLWDQLQALILSNCERIVSPRITAKSLKGVQFIDCNRLQSPILSCENLCKLFYKNCCNVVNVSQGWTPNLKMLEITSCPSLSKLDLSLDELVNCRIESCEKLVSLSLEVDNLKQLNLVNCPILGTVDTKSTKSLLEVTISDCLCISDKVLENLSIKSCFLQIISISRNISLFNPLLRGENIKQVVFVECANLTNVEFYSPSLQNVTFRSCPALKYQTHTRNTSFCLEVVSCSGIENLYLANQRSNIVGCKNLKYITYLNEFPKKACISNCPSLEKTTFEGIGSDLTIRDCEKFRFVAGKSLNRLMLTNCLRFGDESLQVCLENAKDMQSLYLENCSIQKCIVSHVNLVSLYLKKCFLLDQLTMDCPNLNECEILDIPSISSFKINMDTRDLMVFNTRGTKIMEMK